MKKKIVLVGAFLVLSSFAFITPQLSAQAKKKTAAVVVTPTPVPSNVPQVISRADDFPVQDQIINTQEQPVSTENDEERTDSSINDLDTRIKALEANKKNDYDEKQKRLLMNLDILTRAEQRAETLRKQLFEMIEKQNSVQTRIEQLEYEMQPAMIDRYASMAGSLRPEQVREARLKSLESERRNLESLMAQITSTRSSLEANVGKADSLVEKLRAKLEKDIDAALIETDEQN